MRLYTRRRLRARLGRAPTRAGLIAFHASHKYLYLAHSPDAYRTLGRMVASVAEHPIRAAAEMYARKALAALAVPTTRGKHANVLEHILGHFRDVLAAADRREIGGVIAGFRAGAHDLCVPIELVARQLSSSDLGGWLTSQVYFEPYPRRFGRPPRMG